MFYLFFSFLHSAGQLEYRILCRWISQLLSYPEVNPHAPFNARLKCHLLPEAFQSRLGPSFMQLRRPHHHRTLSPAEWYSCLCICGFYAHGFNQWILFLVMILQTVQYLNLYTALGGKSDQGTDSRIREGEHTQFNVAWLYISNTSILRFGDPYCPEANSPCVLTGDGYSCLLHFPVRSRSYRVGLVWFSGHSPIPSTVWWVDTFEFLNKRGRERISAKFFNWHREVRES